VVILLTSLVDGCRKESVSSCEEVEEGTRMWGSAPSRPALVHLPCLRSNTVRY